MFRYNNKIPSRRKMSYEEGDSGIEFRYRRIQKDAKGSNVKKDNKKLRKEKGN